MDCDDVELLLAAAGDRTWSPQEDVAFHAHLEGCELCRQVAGTEDRYRWIVRIPEDALDDADLLVLPTVDPVVFTSEHELARGGMGRITRARDRRLGRDVAIKEVLDPTMRARFEREVAITAQLQHPAIVPVYEAGTWPDGSAFYTMRLVAGGTLAEAIAKTKTLEERLALLPHVVALTEALAYAHSKGIIHRDLKPGNVLVGEFGETVVIDWGLGKELRRNIGEVVTEHASPPTTGELTIAGAVFGTPCFMSPEQASGGTVDERSDVYALGAILYNVLAGQPPYWDEGSDRTPDRVVAMVRERPPVPLVELAPRVPADLRAIVERSMARAMNARFATAVEMAEELRRFQAGQLLRSREYRSRELVARWIRRHRTTVIVAAIALIAVLAIGAGAVINVARSRASERDARELAEGNVATLLVEQGRAQLLDGDRDRALAYLSEAYRRGEHGTALRHMLAATTRDFELAEYTLDRSPHQITSTGFLADGRIATIDDSRDAMIAIWDRDRLVASHPIEGSVRASFLDPHARRAAIVTDNGRIAMVDVETGREVWWLQDEMLASPEVVFDAAGSRVVVIADQTWKAHWAQLRDVSTGALIDRLVVGTGLPTVAAFSADGHRLAMCDTTGAIAVWDLATRARLPPPTPGLCGSGLAFLGNTKLVVKIGEDDVRLWDLETNRGLPLSVPAGTIAALGISPRFDRIAIGDATNAVSLWSADGRLVGRTINSPGLLDRLVFSPDGAFAAGGGISQRTDLWDAAALDQVGRVGASSERIYDQMIALAWSPDSRHLATLRANESHVHVYRTPSGHRIARTGGFAADLGVEVAVIATATGLEVRRLDTGTLIRTVAVAEPFRLDLVATSRDGRRALVWSWAHSRAVIYDLQAGVALVSPNLDAPDGDRFEVALSRNGRFVLEFTARDHDRSPVRVLDADTGRTIREVVIPHVISAAISPDGDRIAVVAAHGLSRMIRVSTGEEVPLPPFDRLTMHVRFDASGRRIIVCNIESAYVVDAITGVTIAKLSGLSGAVETAQFDGSGHRVLTWNTGGIAKLWNADTGTLVASVEGVSSYAIAISDDGLRFATGGDDGSIRIWDSVTGRLLEVVHNDTPSISGLVWSSDGTRLLAQTNSPLATSIWDVHLEQRTPAEIAELARRAGAWRVVDGLLVPQSSSP